MELVEDIGTYGELIVVTGETSRKEHGIQARGDIFETATEIFTHDLAVCGDNQRTRGVRGSTIPINLGNRSSDITVRRRSDITLRGMLAGIGTLLGIHLRILVAGVVFVLSERSFGIIISLTVVLWSTGHSFERLRLKWKNQMKLVAILRVCIKITIITDDSVKKTSE